MNLSGASPSQEIPWPHSPGSWWPHPPNSCQVNLRQTELCGSGAVAVTTPNQHLPFAGDPLPTPPHLLAAPPGWGPALNRVWDTLRGGSTDIQRIIRKLYELLYANKLYNLEGLGKFLETYDLPKLSQDRLQHLPIPITTHVTEAGITTLPTNRSPGADGFTGNLTKHSKKSHLSLSNYPKKFKRREDSQVHFMRPALS